MSKKKSKIRFTNAAILSALNACRGKVYLAAKQLGCHHSTVYERAALVPDIQAVIDQVRGERVDVAETALERAVLNGEAWAVCFTLKTQGKDRGYVERGEYTGADGGPITTVIETVVRTREEAKQLLSRLGEAGRVP